MGSIHMNVADFAEAAQHGAGRTLVLDVPLSEGLGTAKITLTIKAFWIKHDNVPITSAAIGLNGLTPAISAPGLGSPPATSVPGLGSLLPHLRRDRACPHATSAPGPSSIAVGCLRRLPLLVGGFHDETFVAAGSSAVCRTRCEHSGGSFRRHSPHRVAWDIMLRGILRPRHLWEPRGAHCAAKVLRRARHRASRPTCRMLYGACCTLYVASCMLHAAFAAQLKEEDTGSDKSSNLSHVSHTDDEGGSRMSEDDDSAALDAVPVVIGTDRVRRPLQVVRRMLYVACCTLHVVKLQRGVRRRATTRPRRSGTVSAVRPDASVTLV